MILVRQPRRLARPARAVGRPVGVSARPARAVGRPVGVSARPARAVGRPVGVSARPARAAGRSVSPLGPAMVLALGGVGLAAVRRMLERTGRRREAAVRATGEGRLDDTRHSGRAGAAEFAGRTDA